MQADVKCEKLAHNFDGTLQVPLSEEVNRTNHEFVASPHDQHIVAVETRAHHSSASTEGSMSF